MPNVHHHTPCAPTTQHGCAKHAIAHHLDSLVNYRTCAHKAHLALLPRRASQRVCTCDALHLTCARVCIQMQ
jgi:hypothetical protein